LLVFEQLGNQEQILAIAQGKTELKFLH
jgi:hypothetical protein